ncbi:MAG: YggS family pyridoxal phosphate-dependent enzyme [Eggerthellaceae bacterium]|nr:YggS family pyridoxal phosphate-dependent enzyme [Eggerthellaceae bacterium]
MTGLAQRYQALIDEVAQCCCAAGRDEDSLRVLAVSKTVGVDALAEAVAAGISDFGENRPDDLAVKQEAFPEKAWHFIGNIQSRRIPVIVACADMVHSLYQEHHIEALERAAAACGKVQKVLLEVNTSKEANKQGLTPERVAALLEQCDGRPSLKVCGFMTMAPQGDPARARSCFDALAETADEMRRRFAHVGVGQDLHELSMGMSEDWPCAVAAGATIIRVGRVIFDGGYAHEASNE